MKCETMKIKRTWVRTMKAGFRPGHYIVVETETPTTWHKVKRELRGKGILDETAILYSTNWSTYFTFRI